jgi:hypothetical protein
MPSTMFHSGDPCSCLVTVCNASGATLNGYPLFVVLDVYGAYFFAPSFTSYDNYLSAHPSFEVGETPVQVLPEFPWPSGVGSASGLNWYTAMTDPAITGLYGELGMWTFGWE